MQQENFTRGSVLKKSFIVPFSLAILLWASSATASITYGGWGGCNPSDYNCDGNPLKSFMDVGRSDVTISHAESATWNFDLDRDVLQPGDVGIEDRVVSAELDIAILGLALAKITIFDPADEFFLQDREIVFFYDRAEYNVLAGLTFDHKLNLTIQNKSSLFNSGMIVTDVTLSGNYCDLTPSPVPIPSTILLFGSGLAGIIGSRVRKKKECSIE